MCPGYYYAWVCSDSTRAGVLNVRTGIVMCVCSFHPLVLLILKEGESAEGWKVVRNDPPERGNFSYDLPILEGEGPFLASLHGRSLTYAVAHKPLDGDSFCCIPKDHMIYGCAISSKGSHHWSSEPLQQSA